MPVVVTGASGMVGRALLRRLRATGGEVRALVRSPEAADRLRAETGKVAAVDLSDVEHVALIMHDAHTVCHLAGGLDLAEHELEEANLWTAEWVLRAATDAGVARVLFLSYPGASPDAANAYLRAKGRAEEAVRASGLEHAIVRSTHVYGPGSRWLQETRRLARAPVALVVGTGRQRIAPVFVEDVAAVLAAADDRGREVRGTFGLQGPDVVTADELARLLGGPRKPRVHLSPRTAARVAGLAGRRPSAAALEVLAADSLADAPDALAEFGVAPTPLAPGVAASL